MVSVGLHVSLTNDTHTLPMNAKGGYLINEVESGPTVNKVTTKHSQAKCFPAHCIQEW
jgi:hypothetical protein